MCRGIWVNRLIVFSKGDTKQLGLPSLQLGLRHVDVESRSWARFSWRPSSWNEIRPCVSGGNAETRNGKEGMDDRAKSSDYTSFAFSDTRTFLYSLFFRGGEEFPSSPPSNAKAWRIFEPIDPLADSKREISAR